MYLRKILTETFTTTNKKLKENNLDPWTNIGVGKFNHDYICAWQNIWLYFVGTPTIFPKWWGPEVVNGLTE